MYMLRKPMVYYDKIYLCTPTVRSKCNIFSIIRSCVICFSFAYANQFILFFVHLFSLFFGVNLGVYPFLSVFAPSLAFPCCFIFISAFLQFYFPHVLAYFHIVVLQYSLGSSVWSALSAVLFSFVASLFALFAVRFTEVFSGRNNVSVLHSPRFAVLLFPYSNLPQSQLVTFLLFYRFSFNPHSQYQARRLQ